MSIARILTQFSKRFAHDEAGNVMLLFGLSVIFLVAAGGAGIDLGRQQIMKSRIQQSADAAGVSAADLATPTVSGITNTQRANAATRYFNLNWPAKAGIPPTPVVTFPVVAGVTSVKVSVPSGSLHSDVNEDYVDVAHAAATLHASGSSMVQISSSSTSNDFDLVVTVGESVASGSFMVNTNVTNPGPSTRLGVIKSYLPGLIDGMMPAGGAPNLNIRFGLTSFTSYVRNKWPLTSNRTDALGYINHLATQPLALSEDDGRAGIEEGSQMLSGYNEICPMFGHVDSYYACTNPIPGFGGGPCAASQTPVGSGFGCTVSCPLGTPATSAGAVGDIYEPATATTRAPGAPSWTGPGGGCGTSPRSLVRHLVFITSGPIGPMSGVTDTFPAACTSAKWQGSVIYVVNVGDTNPADIAAMTACASINPVTGTPFYYTAMDQVALSGVFSTIVTAAKAIRISQ